MPVEVKDKNGVWLSFGSFLQKMLPISRQLSAELLRMSMLTQVHKEAFKNSKLAT